MANKPNGRNWNDVQMVIATVSMMATLVLWNLFAGPDRVKAEGNSQPTATPPPTDPPIVASLAPAALAPMKIILNGVPPQTPSPQIPLVQTNSPKRRNNNGGSNGTTTTTKSS